jgi:hypothetical protein
VAEFKDDLDILNYALTLELLEAELYRQIVAGGKLSGDEQQFATDFGAQEAAHVTALRQTIQQLGGTPVAAPVRYTFPAFDTRDTIVNFLVAVEELGAGAYLGAAPEITNPDVLTAAVQIHNVEGGHASVWQLQAGKVPVAGPFATPAKRADVLATVAPLLGSTAATAGGPSTAAGTTANPTAPGTGGATSPALPTTGRPRGHTPRGSATIVAGVAAVAAGAIIRARTRTRRTPRASPGTRTG